MTPRCARSRLTVYAIIFSAMLVFAPFVLASPVTPPQPNESVYGLHPDLIKGAFGLLMSLVGFFLLRTLIKMDRNQSTLNRNQSTLFDNQRKLAVTLAQIVTAHNINHRQTIELPNLSDSDSGGN